MKVKIINHIKELRKAKGLTQTQLADLVGISKNAISEFERCNYFPALDTAFLISKILDSDVNEVFEVTYYDDSDIKKDLDFIQLSFDEFDEWCSDFRSAL